jgi:hypothetical protein
MKLLEVERTSLMRIEKLRKPEQVEEVERTMHNCYILELFGRHQQHTFCRSTDDEEAPGR